MIVGIDEIAAEMLEGGGLLRGDADMAQLHLGAELGDAGLGLRVGEGRLGGSGSGKGLALSFPARGQAPACS